MMKNKEEKIFRSNAYVRIAQTPQNPKYKNRITLNGARLSDFRIYFLEMCVTSLFIFVYPYLIFLLIRYGFLLH